MARYKPVDPHLSKMLPVRFADQILLGTYEYAHSVQKLQAKAPR